ncbi:MAG: hypothetical protein JXB36_14665 [Gammaproteobacteria bacterium]|nr:hypothetical protein [Gammaproteobacteria bacterium]
MRNRFTGALVTAAAASLAVGAVQAQQQERPERILGHPNLNGIWQALNTAHWNLEAHSAEALEEFWQLGALGAIPAGQSVVREGEIPYLPEARQKRDENRANWPEADPVVKCYMPGIPRATYMPFPFQIFQGDGDILMVYPFASTNRVINLEEHAEAVVDTWMGYSNGRWEDDTLVVETTGFNGQTWLDRAGNHHSNQLTVTERFTLIGPDHIQYEATLEDPQTYSEPWTIEMPLYRIVDENQQLLEYKCVPFTDMLLYHDLLEGLPDEEESQE